MSTHHVSLAGWSIDQAHEKTMAASKSRRLGYVAGIAVAASSLWKLSMPDRPTMKMPGPFNTGHEEVACDSCHRSAPGTFRQQIQANVRWLIGERRERADVGAKPVDNAACSACHDRPDDRHPTFRF